MHIFLLDAFICLIVKSYYQKIPATFFILFFFFEIPFKYPQQPRKVFVAFSTVSNQPRIFHNHLKSNLINKEHATFH